MKVIISVSNPEHVKFPAFASIIMDQFKIDADFDDDRIVHYIHSKLKGRGGVNTDSCVQEGSSESDIAHLRPQIESPSECYVSDFVLRNAVDAMNFFHSHEEQFMHYFSLHSTDVVLKPEALLDSHGRAKHRIAKSFHLSSRVEGKIEFVEQYLKTLPSQLYRPVHRIFHDTSIEQYQRLVAIESRVMSCIRSHYSYKQHKGEEDPLSCDLNISVRMKPPLGPNGLRY